MLLSALAFWIAFKPPHGLPPVPPRPSLKEGFSKVREWAVLWITVYALPIERVGLFILVRDMASNLFTKTAYYIVSAIECYQILTSPTLQLKQVYPAFVSLAVCVLGSLFRLWCYKALGDGFGYDLARVGARARSDKPVKPSEPKLITSGPYSIVRHPSYLGCWLVFVPIVYYHLFHGMVVRSFLAASGWMGAFIVGFWMFPVGLGTILVTMRISDEDALMRKQFPEDWASWSEQVKYRLVPGVY
ncbi:hypothetical protein PQX77_012149 [Marasmius sp. AFHP31]|nr:hypothetical protein PQX77_012149 [Marasmius sp. AFHP31]